MTVKGYPDLSQLNVPEYCWVFLAGVILLVVCTGIGYFSGPSSDTGTLPCTEPPPDIMVDGMAEANVFTWNDRNGNSVIDDGEPPLPWVTIWIGYPKFMTDADGRGRAWQFMAGCACDCWKWESVYVEVPSGYRATTPTETKLTGEIDTYVFGFQFEEDVQLVSFLDEPDWWQAFWNRGLAPMAFRYSPDGHLAISLDTTTALDEEEVVSELLDIIHTLDQDHDILITEVEVTLVLSDEVILCVVDTPSKWRGKPLTVIQKYCDHSKTAEPE